jgi:hypothetical protein
MSDTGSIQRLVILIALGFIAGLLLGIAQNIRAIRDAVQPAQQVETRR